MTCSEQLTVLIPVLNARPYLVDALASIKMQTGVDFTVIAWDNGSTDGSVEILKEWIPAKLPGKIITGCPLPLGSCMAKLVDMAPTEFCARMDADDVCLPGRFEKQIQALLDDERLAAVGGQVKTIDHNGAPYIHTLYYRADDVDIAHGLLINPALAQPAVCFRKSAVIAVGNYRDVLPEDYDLWLRLAARYRLRNLAEHVLFYRFHPASTSQTGKPPFRRENVDRVFAAAAGPLYGCREKELLALRQRRVSFAAPKLLRIAGSLSRRDGLPFTSRMRMDSFREAIHALVGPHDVVTRIWIALFRPTSRLIFREIRQVIREFLQCMMPGGPQT